MIALIPMAGAGSRFTEKGYTTPKPLLDIHGKPMVVEAALSLPTPSKYIFVVRDFQIKQFSIDKHLRNYFPGAEITTLDHLTEGQAITCMHGLENVNDDTEIVIGASDNGMIYDRKLFDKVKESADVIVFTFRNNPTVKEKPKAYGWVKTTSQNDVEKVSVKIPISDQPINDHAVVGAFWFKNAGIFKRSVERMKTQNRRVNNEFYVDECINDAVELGYKVKAFEIQHYVCWGTPNDYETFMYWEGYYKKFSNQFR